MGQHGIRLGQFSGSGKPLIDFAYDLLYELNDVLPHIIGRSFRYARPSAATSWSSGYQQLLERIKAGAEDLRYLAAELERITGQLSHAAALLGLRACWSACMLKPDAIPNLLQEYRDAIGQLGTWIPTSGVSAPARLTS